MNAQMENQVAAQMKALSTADLLALYHAAGVKDELRIYGKPPPWINELYRRYHRGFAMAVPNVFEYRFWNRDGYWEISPEALKYIALHD